MGGSSRRKGLGGRKGWRWSGNLWPERADLLVTLLDEGGQEEREQMSSRDAGLGLTTAKWKLRAQLSCFSSVLSPSRLW